MRISRVGQPTTIAVLMVLASDHITGAVGRTLNIWLKKAGGPFVSISPTVVERGFGWYDITLTGAHCDTPGDLVLHIEASACDPSDLLLRLGAEAIWAENADTAAAIAGSIAEHIRKRLLTTGNFIALKD